MTRANDQKGGPVHYSYRVPPTIMYTEGTGACCKTGTVTSFIGLVTCPDCVDCVGAPQNKETHGKSGVTIHFDLPTS